MNKEAVVALGRQDECLAESKACQKGLRYDATSPYKSYALVVVLFSALTALGGAMKLDDSIVHHQA